jgi:hypothetical protein
MPNPDARFLHVRRSSPVLISSIPSRVKALPHFGYATAGSLLWIGNKNDVFPAVVVIFA